MISGFNCGFTYPLFIAQSPRFVIFQPPQKDFPVPLRIRDCKVCCAVFLFLVLGTTHDVL
jgi:hypothetical protein